MTRHFTGYTLTHNGVGARPYKVRHMVAGRAVRVRHYAVLPRARAMLERLARADRLPAHDFTRPMDGPSWWRVRL